MLHSLSTLIRPLSCTKLFIIKIGFILDSSIFFMQLLFTLIFSSLLQYFLFPNYFMFANIPCVHVLLFFFHISIIHWMEYVHFDSYIHLKWSVYISNSLYITFINYKKLQRKFQAWKITRHIKTKISNRNQCGKHLSNVVALYLKCLRAFFDYL